MSTSSTTEFNPPPNTSGERNPDRWLLAEMKRLLKWGASVLNIYGKHKRSLLAATVAECLSAAAGVIEGRLEV